MHIEPISSVHVVPIPLACFSFVLVLRPSCLCLWALGLSLLCAFSLFFVLLEFNLPESANAHTLYLGCCISIAAFNDRLKPAGCLALAASRLFA